MNKKKIKTNKNRRRRPGKVGRRSQIKMEGEKKVGKDEEKVLEKQRNQKQKYVNFGRK